ncbi:cytochrome P450 monooxygenase [Panus rudis PR-1116 ss-1]|nr:cytochrome P450 monooxygenase [Panus rudis PR-1116 ss-1]
MLAQLETSSIMSPSGLLVIAALLGLLVYISSIRKEPLPPGPKRLPIIGNVHQLPKEFPEQTFAEWRKQFGDLIFIKLFRTPTIILNSREVAHELMEKRSKKYSDRHRLVFINEMIGLNHALANVRYGEEFRVQRKWIQEALQGKQTLDSYLPIMRRERHTLLHNLLETPENFVDHLGRYMSGVVMEISYGRQLQSNEDYIVKNTDEANAIAIQAGSAGNVIVDVFPILKHIPGWMPGAGFKRLAMHANKLVRELYDRPYDEIREQMASGTASPSYATSLIERNTVDGKIPSDYETYIKGALLTMFTAGTETVGPDQRSHASNTHATFTIIDQTVTAMITFFLAMTRNPAVYKKMQEELDRVVGKDRLPELDDRDSLPYVEAVVKETLRWRPPTPLGLPHWTNEGDVFRGYRIPPQSSVIANIWGMSRDENVYQDADEFWPERFLPNERGAPEADSADIVFGFGRRRCPGSDFALRNMFLLIASIASTLDIGKVTEGGVEITPSAEFVPGIVSRPKPFRCRITARSQMAIDLITHSFQGGV